MHIYQFQFHQPLDHTLETLPVKFDDAVQNPSLSKLAIPGPADRMGYATESAADYIAWGSLDHSLLMEKFEAHSSIKNDMSILDFGCSTGRVLRHFDIQAQQNNWNLYGCDIQARCIQWMREHFPKRFNVSTCSTIPSLPFEDNTFDFIYGFSVFTHIKYQWDAWLLELRRVMKPNGIMIQTFHAEPAWEFYAQHSEEQWIRDAHSSRVYDYPNMDVDYFYHGSIDVSQIFWKEKVAVDYWSRYLNVLETTPPPERSFQNWIITKK